MLGFYIVFSRFLRHCYPDTTLSFVLPSSPCLHLNTFSFPIFLYKHKFHDGRSIVLLARMAYRAWGCAECVGCTQCKGMRTECGDAQSAWACAECVGCAQRVGMRAHHVGMLTACGDAHRHSAWGCHSVVLSEHIAKISTPLGFWGCAC